MEKRIEFKTKITLLGGKYASKKNMDKIYATSSRLCTNIHDYGIDPKTYHEKWVIKKEREGYIFREVTHGGGISGHWPSVRSLIINSSGSSHITIFIEK